MDAKTIFTLPLGMKDFMTWIAAGFSGLTALIYNPTASSVFFVGMDFHDLLDIPQGDRRKYHDDVTVMVISLEGRIWKSSGKYF